MDVTTGRHSFTALSPVSTEAKGAYPRFTEKQRAGRLHIFPTPLGKNNFCLKLKGPRRSLPHLLILQLRKVSTARKRNKVS